MDKNRPTWRVIGRHKWRVTLGGHSLVLTKEKDGNVTVDDPEKNKLLFRGASWEAMKTLALRALDEIYKTPAESSKTKKRWRVSCVWQETGDYYIEAASEEEAREIAMAEPLPKESSYLEDSFEIDSVSELDSVEPSSPSTTS